MNNPEEIVVELLSDEAKRLLAEALPDDILYRESARRQLGIYGALVALGIEDDSAFPEAGFAANLRHFLEPEKNPDREIGVTEQLSLSREFWRKLGYRMPLRELGKDGKNSIAEALSANPFLRVIPTLMPIMPTFSPAGPNQPAEMSPNGRLEIVKRANLIQPPLTAFEPKPLYIHPQGSVYERLLAEPETKVAEGKELFGLRYMSALQPGQLVTRSLYLEELLSSHQAILDGQGNLWTFPVLDPRSTVRESHEKEPQKILESVDPICSPETLIVLCLYHHLNRKPLIDKYMYTNEAVYRLDKFGITKDIEYFPACVFRRGLDPQIAVGAWGAANISADDRSLKSGLPKLSF